MVMKRLVQVCLGLAVTLFAIALATGCMGCGTETEYVGIEAPNSVTDPTPTIEFGQPPPPPTSTLIDPEDKIVNGQICDDNQHEILYGADGKPAVCADASTKCEGVALFRSNGQQVCEEAPPAPITYPAEQCDALSSADGHWTALWKGNYTNQWMDVTCTPTENGACAVTPSGEGSSFNEITFIGTEFPLSKQIGINTLVMDITEDGWLVQRHYVNLDGVEHLSSEVFFRQ